MASKKLIAIDTSNQCDWQTFRIPEITSETTFANEPWIHQAAFLPFHFETSANFGIKAPCRFAAPVLTL